jgi:hypothetical protein
MSPTKYTKTLSKYGEISLNLLQLSFRKTMFQSGSLKSKNVRKLAPSENRNCRSVFNESSEPPIHLSNIEYRFVTQQNVAPILEDVYEIKNVKKRFAVLFQQYINLCRL